MSLACVTWRFWWSGALSSVPAVNRHATQAVFETDELAKLWQHNLKL